MGPAKLRCAAPLLTASSDSVATVADRIPAVAKAMTVSGAWSKAQEQADSQIEKPVQTDARIVSCCDRDYPTLLRQSADDPTVLFIRGTLAPDPFKSVAVVGTREPTPHGRMIAQRMTQYFVEQGWSIVSGLALGCDTVAHQTAIEAGGHTVAVLGHGLETVLPVQNRVLADKILEVGGALISEFIFGKAVLPGLFAKRDKTQAGLSRGVVMVQAALDGGSLHAAQAAIGYGRWLAVPYPTPADCANEPKCIGANYRLVPTSSDLPHTFGVSQNGLKIRTGPIFPCRKSFLRLSERRVPSRSIGLTGL